MSYFLFYSLFYFTLLFYTYLNMQCIYCKKYQILYEKIQFLYINRTTNVIILTLYKFVKKLYKLK